MKSVLPAADRLGLVLFALYCLLYGGFILAETFSPGLMKSTPLFGITLAVWSGMALIIAAVVLALVYAFARRAR